MRSTPRGLMNTDASDTIPRFRKTCRAIRYNGSVARRDADFTGNEEAEPAVAILLA